MFGNAQCLGKSLLFGKTCTASEQDCILSGTFALGDNFANKCFYSVIIRHAHSNVTNV